MIRTRRGSAGWATMAGLLAVIPSIALGAPALIAGAHVPEPQYWRILFLFMLPTAVLLIPVVVLSHESNRLAAIGAGITATLSGYVLLFGWYGLDRTLNWQGVVYVNETGQEIVVYYAWEGEPLSRSYSLMPGQTEPDLMGFRRQGPWLRFVALSAGDRAVHIRQLGLYEYDRRFPWQIHPQAEGAVADRKLFDHSFTWDDLSQLRGRVVFADDNVRSEANAQKFGTHNRPRYLIYAGD